MSRLCRNLVLGLTLWLAATASAFASDVSPIAPQPDGSSQQVLVLLRLPPEHLRPHTDYGGGYGDGLGRSARNRIAGRLARHHGLTLVGDWPMPLLGVDCFIMAVPTGQSADEAASGLSSEPDVAWSEPMHLYHGQGGASAPNDPLFPAQPAARAWRLAELHEVATGRDVRVAVVDSMIDKAHPDLAGQIQVSQNFVPDHSDAPEQHGTGVAGIIAARADNGLGIAGVAPEARLMALRACWQTTASKAGDFATTCDSLSLAKAIYFAIEHNAQVINLSLSGPPDALLGRLLDMALARSVTVVGAFDRDLPGGGFPASHAGVVAVTDEISGPDMAGLYVAPGRDVPTTQPGGRWSLVNGSSYSAAHVSGLFALLRERLPRGRAALTLVTVHPGGGPIDACATLLQGEGACGCACARAQQSSAIVRR
ncbi:MAG TPA: S8 family serine peptidase [Caulobacteraceae bacterium]|jgi:hypothetical protein